MQNKPQSTVTQLGFTPTKEQLDILEAFNAHRVIKVNASAGTGKSSTLLFLANSYNDPNVSSLYVCFNKSVQLEAERKFPERVKCLTTHGLAGEAKAMLDVNDELIKYENKYRLKCTTPSGIADYYVLPAVVVNNDVILTPAGLGLFVQKTLHRFQYSADSGIRKHHVPQRELAKKFDGLDFNYEPVVELIISVAKRLWTDRITPGNGVGFEFDTYLKVFQLEKRKLDYDVIFLDEAQDSNDCVLDIINNQKHAKIVYVGDTFQSIYAFRGAKNAMEVINAPTFLLSKSFRFGQEIADLATVIIKKKMKIKGFEKINSKIDKVKSTKYTMLFRTNQALVDKAIELIKQRKKILVDAGVKNFTHMLESCVSLHKGRSGYHDAIKPFANWKEFLVAAEEDPEYKRLAKIVESGKAKYYLDCLKQIVAESTEHKQNQYQPKQYDVLLTTAHKAKGKEWSNVIIGDDFDLKTIFKEEEEQGYDQQEVNLFYVACTRAINTLQLCAGIEEYIYIGEQDD